MDVPYVLPSPVYQTDQETDRQDSLKTSQSSLSSSTVSNSTTVVMATRDPARQQGPWTTEVWVAGTTAPGSAPAPPGKSPSPPGTAPTTPGDQIPGTEEDIMYTQGVSTDAPYSAANTDIPVITTDINPIQGIDDLQGKDNSTTGVYVPHTSTTGRFTEQTEPNMTPDVSRVFTGMFTNPTHTGIYTGNTDATLPGTASTTNKPRTGVTEPVIPHTGGTERSTEGNTAEESPLVTAPSQTGSTESVTDSAFPDITQATVGNFTVETDNFGLTEAYVVNTTGLEQTSMVSVLPEGVTVTSSPSDGDIVSQPRRTILLPLLTSTASLSDNISNQTITDTTQSTTGSITDTFTSSATGNTTLPVSHADSTEVVTEGLTVDKTGLGYSASSSPVIDGATDGKGTGTRDYGTSHSTVGTIDVTPMSAAGGTTSVVGGIHTDMAGTTPGITVDNTSTGIITGDSTPSTNQTGTTPYVPVTNVNMTETQTWTSSDGLLTMPSSAAANVTSLTNFVTSAKTSYENDVTTDVSATSVRELTSNGLPTTTPLPSSTTPQTPLSGHTTKGPSTSGYTSRGYGAETTASPGGSGGLGAGMVAGIVVLVIMLIIVIILLVIFLIRRARINRSRNNGEDNPADYQYRTGNRNHHPSNHNHGNHSNHGNNVAPGESVPMDVMEAPRAGGNYFRPESSGTSLASAGSEGDEPPTISVNLVGSPGDEGDVGPGVGTGGGREVPSRISIGPIMLDMDDDPGSPGGYDNLYTAGTFKDK